MEEGRAEVVHMNVTSVTTPEVTPSLMLPSATQLDWASMPTIIEELVLHKSTFVAKINNNDEPLGASSRANKLAPGHPLQEREFKNFWKFC